jgi:hypothetical protein
VERNSSDSFDHSSGREDKGPATQNDRGYWSSLKKEVDEACEYFWSRDQICGFTDDGKRIGTGIPRRMKQFAGSHEYSL